MLYNPNWNLDPHSLTSLIAWLEKQPADKKYNYLSGRHCLLAQYFEAHGFTGIRVCANHYIFNRQKTMLPKAFDEIALGDKWWPIDTFGDALKRARKYL